jgi:hypothetical protein
MDSCSGPCLKHCYSKSKIKYIMIGIFFGLVISFLLKKNKKDKIKKKKSNNQYDELSKIYKI